MELTHAQLAAMSARTAGYLDQPFDVSVTATGQAYLTVLHVVYVVDRDGFLTARSRADGSVLYQSALHQP